MNTEIQGCLNQMKEMQDIVINYLDTEDGIDDIFQNFLRKVSEFNLHEDYSKIKLLLHLIIQISNNHHRSPGFFNKIEKLILEFKDDITHFFSNFTIFNITKSNKRVLLIFIENRMITIDSSIAQFIMGPKYLYNNYHLYFLPEIKNFITNELYNKFLKYIQENNIDEKDFNDLRKESENETYLCQLIRNDLIDDFVTYQNRTNLSVSYEISNSIFETNLFLLKNKPALIEYAAFFGSIQIFKYLVMNQANLSSSLWNYAVHSNNAELIHLLESFQLVQPNDANEAYNNYAAESIKCFHDDFANYIFDQHIDKQNRINNQIKYLKYRNFNYITLESINQTFFIELCKYDYINFVKLFLGNNSDDKILESISKLKIFIIL